MRKWIAETIRPISFLVVIPVLLGTIVSGTRMDYHIIYALLGGILATGFANSFNSLVDRKVDRLNPAKKTLALRSPVSAMYGVLFILPPLAFCLRYSQFNHVLLATLLYLSFLYSYLFGNIPVFKRLSVAAITASTVFLYVSSVNLPLWVLAAVVFAFIFHRESRKDVADRMEDTLMKFAWIKNGLELNWWQAIAPILGGAIYLSCFWLVGQRISSAEVAISLGIMISVWAYIQIRYKYQQYRVRMVHRSSGGRLGIVVALVGLMPSFVNPVFLILVMINSASILYRSFLGRISFKDTAIAHDAYLWASLPIMVMTKVGLHPTLLVVSLALASITCANMYKNRLRATALG